MRFVARPARARATCPPVFCAASQAREYPQRLSTAWRRRAVFRRLSARGTGERAGRVRTPTLGRGCGRRARAGARARAQAKRIACRAHTVVWKGLAPPLVVHHIEHHVAMQVGDKSRVGRHRVTAPPVFVRWHPEGRFSLNELKRAPAIPRAHALTFRSSPVVERGHDDSHHDLGER